ncbi:YlbF family regulator [Kineothrix sp. MB12-C1]|uniref:YlbF family regulator n=1 Tax=Kineothrix sp. MB12-C1 TaxID=3070215 RepID=UPI0027D2017B|nr:YlbF family regulator [Kineothrix sp. MB12-C1]WMC91569.1 YlbF family regulator [Kineothrix sp. MB12-C1]
MTGSINDAAKEFVGAVRNSSEYREYVMQLNKIKNQPELYEKVNEFRRKNFIFQNEEESDDLLDRLEELDREYESLYDIPLVADFFEAETSFCRMMQDTTTLIVNELDFQ